MNNKTNKKVSLFHIGPQKTGRTWLYRCLKEHPEISAPNKDVIYYFDINHHKGENWYHKNFKNKKEKQTMFDPTPSYIRSPWTPERIANYNPSAKIIITMRDPIERAFSHYWHNKKKGDHNYDFSRIFSNYDLFSSWLEPGFYGRHIEKYLKFFPREQILCLLFDDLKKNSQEFLNKIFEFAEINPNFESSILNQKINPSRPKKLKNIKRLFGKINCQNWIKTIENSQAYNQWGQKEYLQGVPEQLKKDLYKICKPEIERTEKVLGINLNIWKKKYEDNLRS